MRVRFVRSGDAEAIAAIYAPIVRDTAISFESAPPDADEIRRRIAALGTAWPWIVIAGDDDDDRISGYAYAGAFRNRHAYRFGAEVTVYVAEEARGRGCGARLYAALTALLRAQGFRRAYAGISLPNDASVRLHEACGFTHAGTVHAAGYKFERWHDVAFYEAPLAPLDRPDRDPLPLDALDSGIVVAALSAT
jgi:phosphinothricin acetyltransferase